MSSKRDTQVRELLRSASDGLTVNQMMGVLGWPQNEVSRVLNRMPDTYIDRWVKNTRYWRAVWCAAEVPSDCPRPRKRTP